MPHPHWLQQQLQQQLKLKEQQHERGSGGGGVAGVFAPYHAGDDTNTHVDSTNAGGRDGGAAGGGSGYKCIADLSVGHGHGGGGKPAGGGPDGCGAGGAGCFVGTVGILAGVVAGTGAADVCMLPVAARVWH